MAEKALKNTFWSVQWNFSIGKRHSIEVLFKVIFVYFMYLGDLPTSMSTCITWVVGALGGQKRALDLMGLESCQPSRGTGIQSLHLFPYIGPATSGSYPQASHSISILKPQAKLFSLQAAFGKYFIATTGKEISIHR